MLRFCLHSKIIRFRLSISPCKPNGVTGSRGLESIQYDRSQLDVVNHKLAIVIMTPIDFNLNPTVTGIVIIRC